MCVQACVCECAFLPFLESPRSLRELWKINTLRQPCLFIHLITHYHCITVPLISHHRAQIDTFVLFYHTGVWCNQLNLHLTPDTCIKWTLSMNIGASTTLQYEKEESKCTACVWEEECVCVCLVMARCVAILEVGVEQQWHTYNSSNVRRLEMKGPPTELSERQVSLVYMQVKKGHYAISN